MRRSRGAASRRYWREADARAVLAKFEASGLSMAAFCHKHGLKTKRLNRWRKALGGEGATPRAEKSTPVELLPVRVVQRDRDAGRRGGVEVVLRNGRRLAVVRDFDPALLAEVAAAVESWPC